MTLYEIINLNTIFGLSIKDLEWLKFISIAVIIVILLYQIYIKDIKKRPLNKTEKIIGAICALLAGAIAIIITYLT